MAEFWDSWESPPVTAFVGRVPAVPTQRLRVNMEPQKPGGHKSNVTPSRRPAVDPTIPDRPQLMLFVQSMAHSLSLLCPSRRRLGRSSSHLPAAPCGASSTAQVADRKLSIRACWQTDARPTVKYFRTQFPSLQTRAGMLTPSLELAGDPKPAHRTAPGNSAFLHVYSTSQLGRTPVLPSARCQLVWVSSLFSSGVGPSPLAALS